MTKTTQATTAYNSGDFAKALRIAKTFTLGLSKEDRAQIVRGHECHTNPGFYRQIGRDPENEIKNALRVFSEKILKAPTA